MTWANCERSVANMLARTIASFDSGSVRHIAYLLLLTLYSLVAYQSPGYDDEIFNIELIEAFGIRESILYVQRIDVHPFGGYLLNGVLYSLAGDWRIVRIISAVLNVTAMGYFFEYLFRSGGNRAWLSGAILLALNPAALMWLTGLRWYAYFLPLLLWVLVLPNVRTSMWFWAKPMLGLTLLAYINYAALVLSPAILYWYSINDTRTFRKQLRAAFVCSLIPLIFFSPQAAVLVSNHLPNSAQQTGSVVKAFAGFYISLISNQGVFPVSAGSVASLIGWSLVCWALARGGRQQFMLKSGSFLLGALAMIATGLGAKFRNFLVLMPLQTLSGIWWKQYGNPGKPYGIGLSLILLGNAIGCHNVIRHEDTTKNSWNLPLPQLVTHLESFGPTCDGNIVVAAHEPVIVRKLQGAGYTVIPHFYSSLGQQQQGDHLHTITDEATCLAVVKTFRGSINAERYASMIVAAETTPGDAREHFRLGYDKYFSLKRQLTEDIPDYLIEITLIRNAQQLQKFAVAWSA